MARPRGPSKGKSGWQWSRDPKPEKLAGLVPAAVTAAQNTIRRYLPEIARGVVARIRQRGTVVKDGREAPIPGYSEKYIKRLHREGRPTNPDYTYKGGMLDHLRGRMVRVGNAIEGRVSPYGRIDTLDREGKGKQEGMIWREPYSYTDARRGIVVSVPGQWIRPRGRKEGWTRSSRTLVYNAHLMNLLVSRKGEGHWTSGMIATHHILALTAAEMQEWSRLIVAGLIEPAWRVVQRVAGR